MEFCEKCGSRTTLDKEKSNIVCIKCGHERPIDLEQYKKNHNQLYRTGKKKPEGEKVVVLDEKYKQSKRKTSHKCPYCGNNEAYEQNIPPRWGDEDQLTIYTCVKCGKSDREGYGF